MVIYIELLMNKKPRNFLTQLREEEYRNWAAGDESSFCVAVQIIRHFPRQITLFAISKFVGHFKNMQNNYNYTYMSN